MLRSEVMREIKKDAFVLPPNRQTVTREPNLDGKWRKDFPEMLGFKNQGEGKIPADFAWRTNPKQWQEELTDATLRKRLPNEVPELPEGNPPISSLG
jgi:hypothetical protein